MSRHELSFIHEDKRYDMAIGWDVPLQSYFATVYDFTLQEDHWIIQTVGANALTPIETIADLVRELGKPYNDYINDYMMGKLLVDKAQSPQPSPYQRNMLNFLKGIAEPEPPTIAEADDAAIAEHAFHTNAPHPGCMLCKVIVDGITDDSTTYSDYVAQKMAGELND